MVALLVAVVALLVAVVALLVGAVALLAEVVALLAEVVAPLVAVEPLAPGSGVAVQLVGAVESLLHFHPNYETLPAMTVQGCSRRPR